MHLNQKLGNPKTERISSSLLCLFFLIQLTIVVSASCSEGDVRSCGEYSEGECKQGLQFCENGVWGFCTGQVLPENEICNDSRDNDCDGLVDEGCECVLGDSRSCGPLNETGICQKGLEFCTELGEWSGDCLNSTMPDVEKCGSGSGNGLDDNCDGIIDEGCSLNNETEIPVTCTNRVKDAGEEGIDCGGPCAIKCTVEEDLDEDKDGLTLAMELERGTDPLMEDTDFDGINDYDDQYLLCPNNFCDILKGENHENCPTDCEKEGGNPSWILLIIVISFLGIGLFFYIQFKKSTGKIQDEKKEKPKAWKGLDESYTPEKKSYTRKRVYVRDKKKPFDETETEKMLRESLESVKKGRI